jgi:uncharacterized Zn finger protein
MPDKHAGGAPSKYDPKFIDEVDKYLAESTKDNMRMPKVESFAIWLDVSKKTLYNWGEEHPEFLHALEKIMLYQGERLIDDGIYGGKEVNASIIKLMLQSNHGYKERSDVTSGDEKMEGLIVIKANGDKSLDLANKSN